MQRCSGPRPAVLGRQLRAQPRLAADTAAPRPAARAALRCVALAAESRLPPAPLRRVAFDGAPAGDETLALHTAKESTAVGLVHRYLTLVRQNARRGTASTLTRSEVRGGGRKPFAQKGTGQARRGSKRSPLLVGGGVSFGPKPRDWSIKMNKKERRLAMATALQTAAASITVVDDLTEELFPERKTKVFAAALARWGVAEGEHVLLVTKEEVETVAASARNLHGLVHSPVTALSVYDVLRADKLIVESSALSYLNSWYGEEGAAWE